MMGIRQRDQVSGGGSVAVAVDKDKGSQYALKWAVEQLVPKGQSITLIHVKPRIQTIPTPMGVQVPINEVGEEVAKAFKEQVDNQIKELLLPFRCYCTRKDVQCRDAILEDADISKAIIEYISYAAVENLVLGASSRNALLRRFKGSDVPTNVCKGTPDFCNVYVISKGKISSARSAVRPAPQVPVSRLPKLMPKPEAIDLNFSTSSRESDDTDSIKSPFTRIGRSGAGAGGGKLFMGELTLPDTDISFVSSTGSRSSTDKPSPASSAAAANSLFNHLDIPGIGHSARHSRLSNGHTSSSLDDLDSLSDHINNISFESLRNGRQDQMTTGYSSSSQDSGGQYFSWSSSQNVEDVEAQVKQLKLELKQTMEMYNNACREALEAKKKAKELSQWRREEEQKLEEARMAEGAAIAFAETEKAKCKAAIEAAEAAQRIAELEAKKRVIAEMKVIKESEEKKKALDALANAEVRYRKYCIEEIELATECFNESRKIGEGGYGPVYKCYLDHTPVAVKVLRPDAAQGRMQFQQEVEVLSCIRHPNMVLLLGACPEYGCLVYEYMANGSLEDRLFRRGDSPPLSWQLRFKIAAEIGTGLLFLHQTKPEPLVHRDLKPANILLDRNYVSKISDVGLARLVPPSVANHVTQYRMTSTAGTFCYIDPEYQQTGMLGIKSDIYSLGIMLLQIVTAKMPMGLTHHVERAIEKGTFEEMLDPTVPDWPVEDALSFAKMALKCAELRRKDRPDLGTEILPELNRLRAMAEEHMMPTYFGSSHTSPNSSVVSFQDMISDPLAGSPVYTGDGSILSHSSTSSQQGRSQS